MVYVTASALQKTLALEHRLVLAGIVFSLPTHYWLGKIGGNWICLENIELGHIIGVLILEQKLC